MTCPPLDLSALYAISLLPLRRIFQLLGAGRPGDRGGHSGLYARTGRPPQDRYQKQEQPGMVRQDRGRRGNVRYRAFCGRQRAGRLHLAVREQAFLVWQSSLRGGMPFALRAGGRALPQVSYCQCFVCCHTYFKLSCRTQLDP